MSVYLVGDLHFSASQPWRLPTGDAFLDWLENDLVVEPNSTMIALGDLTDDAVNPGLVVDQVMAFLSICNEKFSHTYLLVGNHDLKLHKNKPHLSFQFAERMKNVTILREPAEVVDIQGIEVLSLPHYNYRTDLPPMKDYYENLPEEYYQKQFDMVIGHFPDTSAPIFGHTIDLTKLRYRLMCLGDIHKRMSSHYIGSMSACNISENVSPEPRAIWKVDKQSDGEIVKTEIEMPHFCDFQIVNYPDDLPEKTSPVTVWTVLGAGNETIAKEFYPNEYIRGVRLGSTTKDVEAAVSAEDFVVKDPMEVFKDWKTETKEVVSRPVMKLMRELFTKKRQLPKANPAETIKGS